MLLASVGNNNSMYMYRRAAQVAARASSSSLAVHQQQQQQYVMGGRSSNHRRIRRSSGTLAGSRHFMSMSAAASSSSSSAFAIPLSSVAVATAAFMATTTAIMTTKTTTTTSCESSSSSSSTNRNKNIQYPRNNASMIGLADEADDTDTTTPNRILLQDGMDASGDNLGVGGNSVVGRSIVGPTDADDDDDNNTNDDDDDDPSMDEETSCSICLINRRGPCRKYWLKFEKCMKEHHSAEKKEMELKEGEKKKDEKEEKDRDGNGNSHQVDDDDDGQKEAVPSLSSLEEGWDAFMDKSTRPGEDDEDDEEEADEDDDEEEEEDVENDGDDDNDDDDDDYGTPTSTNSSTSTETKSSSSAATTSLGARCDKHMIPWIECIQRHRNTYSLISNEFYQGDYIDPLEYSIPEDRRMLFDAPPVGPESDAVGDNMEVIMSNDNEDDDDGGIRSGNGGYVVKFNGVEIDLESWKEHMDAETDNDDDYENNSSSSTTAATTTSDDDGPHLINASAKFQLIDPNAKQSPREDGKHYYDNGQIEVAYIKDQRGRLLGFDSFNSTKKDKGVDINNTDNQGESDEGNASNTTVGECTFHIVPGETTSIVAYAIYRGTTTTTAKDGERYGASSGGSTILREDVLYHTPEIRLPGVGTN